MKIGFSKEGITLDSKKLDPMNFVFKGHGIQFDQSLKPSSIDPFELLTAMAALRDSEDKDIDKMKKLQSIINK